MSGSIARLTVAALLLHATSASADTIDLDAFRKTIRDTVNARVGVELVHDVLIDQVNFLSKDEIRDNAIRRRGNAGDTAKQMTKAFKEH